MQKLPYLLAALATCSLLPAAAPQPARLVVQVRNFGFDPAPIRLAAGRPVTLIFINRSGSGHDFTAPAFFDHARIVAGVAPAGAVALGPHETKSITLVPESGTFHAHCSHFLHKQMGMDEVIVVG